VVKREHNGVGEGGVLRQNTIRQKIRLLPEVVDHPRDLAHYLDEKGTVIWIDGK
jgi:hypothetical protein